jgi:hypothetical protein
MDLGSVLMEAGTERYRRTSDLLRRTCRLQRRTKCLSALE